MSSSLVPSGGFLPSRASRQATRAIEQFNASQLVAMHHHQARLDRVAGTTERAMTRAAQLGALEATLGQVAPNAAGYVHACAAAGALGLAAVVNDAARGL